MGTNEMYSNLEDVFIQLSSQIERAIFVHEETTEELEELDPEKTERWEIENIEQHTAVRLDILWDYLWMMKDQIVRLGEVQDALWKQHKQDGERQIANSDKVS